MQLFIRNLPATLPEDTQIKLTRENPFFTDGGDYTLDVTLPLRDTPQNIAIFGAKHHIEEHAAPMAGVTYPFLLICTPLTFEGTCRVTTITEDSIKVQLTAARSALNNALPEDKYIDQLDLPLLWNEVTYTPEEFGQMDVDTAQDGTHFDTTRGMYQYLTALQRMERTDYQDAAQQKADSILYGRFGQTSAVAFPIHSSSDEENANIITFDYDRARFILPVAETPVELKWPFALAPQPYLLEVIRRILEACGYTLAITEELEQSYLASIIIANVRPTLRLTDFLPHWTLRQFITEVQNFTASVFVVNGTEVSIIPRQDWYNTDAPIVPLYHNQIIDEHTRTLDEDTDTLAATYGNTDYEWPDDCPQLRLPDEVWQRAETLTFKTEAAARAFVDTLSQKQQEESRYLYHITDTEQTFALLKSAEGTWHFTRIDTMPPLLLRDETRNIDTSLKLVPCRQSFPPQPTTNYNNADGNLTQVHPVQELPYLLTSDTQKIGETFSVNEAINPESEDEDERDGNNDTRRDLLEVAIYDRTNHFPVTRTAGGTTFTHHLPQPDACPYAIHPDTSLLTLIPITGTTNRLSLSKGNMLGNIHRNAPVINTDEKLTLRFISTTPPPTDAIFIIRGRRYACESLELNLTHYGIASTITGTFHPLE